MIIPVSFFKTSLACGMGVEIIGQPQLMAYENVPDKYLLVANSQVKPVMKRIY